MINIIIINSHNANNNYYSNNCNNKFTNTNYK